MNIAKVATLFLPILLAYDCGATALAHNKGFKAKLIDMKVAESAPTKLTKNRRTQAMANLVASNVKAKQKTGASRMPASASTGALISVDLQSKVGVLLDAFPTSIKNRMRSQYLSKPMDFWEQRAKQQIEATIYRLVYRNFYYKDKLQLPLPPREQWNIRIGSANIEFIDGHELVMVDYEFSSTLLSSEEQAGKADINLATVGGSWTEPFVLPADPEHLFERTGYSCMDEDAFPPNSVDSENNLTFYDHTCKGGKNFCHVTQPAPQDSCVSSLKNKVGRISAGVVFTRLPWDDTLANQVRVGAANPNGADAEVLEGGLNNNRIIYRYFPASSCAINEGCIGGPGWRRLLQFDASVANRGSSPIHLGDVGSASLAAKHNMIEWSTCHNHYHFSHYGKFVYGNGKLRDGSKRAFCLESTSRYSNNEDTPLTHPYSCSYQGIEAGWGDDYIAGIECQWIDITSVDTNKKATKDTLSFYSNNDQFLCEGKPVLDSNGQVTFVPTTFTTSTGATVDRIDCNFVPNWDANNLHTVDVDVPLSGNTYITRACDRGQDTSIRNCGLSYQPTVLSCNPGSTAKMTCSVPAGAAPQFVRVCEASAALNSGMGCTYRESLANTAVEGSTTVSFVCPAARDSVEKGGMYALYTAPFHVTDPASTVQCTQAK